MKACRVPPRVDEPVSGVLPALPGCNPVQSGPEEAVPQSTCPSSSSSLPGAGAVVAATEIGDPVLPFTDVSGSLRWRYAACARDPAGQARTLDGASDRRADDMTVDACVAFCDGRGFRYAGLENAVECYCGNAVPADRLPSSPGLLGNCDLFPCPGNATQFCGGYAEIGVYEKCDGAECKNMDLPGL